VQARYATVPRVRIELVRDSTSDYPEESVRGASQVWRLLREELTGWDRERFLTLLLDGRHKVLGLEEVSVGTATASLVHPREVFKGAILANAVAFILVQYVPRNILNLMWREQLCGGSHQRRPARSPGGHFGIRVATYLRALGDPSTEPH
jgi:hypothetical protein